jgi:hypothetical protein
LNAGARSGRLFANIRHHNSARLLVETYAIRGQPKQHVVTKIDIPYQADGRNGHDAPRISSESHWNGAIIGLFPSIFPQIKRRYTSTLSVLWEEPGFKNGSAEGGLGRSNKRKRDGKENCWRRGWESNPRIKVLQTSPLPLGYRASILNYIENLLHVSGQSARFFGGVARANLWRPLCTEDDPHFLTGSSICASRRNRADSSGGVGLI